MQNDDAKPAADFDPLAPETFDSSYELYAELRSRCPVARADAWNGFWAVMRYEDVRKAASAFNAAFCAKVVPVSSGSGNPSAPADTGSIPQGPSSAVIRPR